ncbi:MAG: hypothetical protein IKS41_05740 [Alphaproteobacteria bacterium]|nr:hypothetical protein [Alphaproteobacteria bacterium]
MTDIKDILPAFRKKLEFISQSETETLAERQVASFYLKILRPYNYRNLIRQRGFGRGVGGTGDNIIAMPVVERDENGCPIFQDGQLKTTHCMFDDFEAYLHHIEYRGSVRHDAALWMSLPTRVNAIPRDDYTAMWFRHQGWSRDY